MAFNVDRQEKLTRARTSQSLKKIHLWKFTSLHMTEIAGRLDRRPGAQGQKPEYSITASGWSIHIWCGEYVIPERNWRTHGRERRVSRRTGEAETIEWWWKSDASWCIIDGSALIGNSLCVQFSICTQSSSSDGRVPKQLHCSSFCPFATLWFNGIPLGSPQAKLTSEISWRWLTPPEAPSLVSRCAQFPSAANLSLSLVFATALLMFSSLCLSLNKGFGLVTSFGSSFGLLIRRYWCLGAQDTKLLSLVCSSPVSICNRIKAACYSYIIMMPEFWQQSGSLAIAAGAYWVSDNLVFKISLYKQRAACWRFGQIASYFHHGDSLSKVLLQGILWHCQFPRIFSDVDLFLQTNCKYFVV